MLKKIAKPFQNVLVERKLCVGCTGHLTKAKKLGNLSENRIIVECKCKRRYILDKKLNQYRRASFQEEQQYLKSLKK